MAAHVKSQLFVTVGKDGGLEGIWVDTVAREHFEQIHPPLVMDAPVAANAVAAILRAAELSREFITGDGYCGNAFDEWQTEEAPPPAPPVVPSDREAALAQMREWIEDAGPLRTSRPSDPVLLHLIAQLCNLIERTVP